METRVKPMMTMMMTGKRVNNLYTFRHIAMRIEMPTCDVQLRATVTGGRTIALRNDAVLRDTRIELEFQSEPSTGRRHATNWSRQMETTAQLVIIALQVSK